jgi:hypothetical protein
MSMARQRLGKHIPAATNMRTIEELPLLCRLYNEDRDQLEIELRESLEMAVEVDGSVLKSCMSVQQIWLSN